MGHKTQGKKLRLAVARRKNRRLPLFAIARTHRRLQSNITRRNWRTDKLRLKEE